MGGRAWRQGEHWYLSCQWELEKPAALELTGRTAGVKIGAKVLLTTYDDRGQTREYTMPEPDKKLETLHRVAAKQLSRSMEAQKKREKKITANGYSQRREKRLATSGKKDRRLRLRRASGFYEAAARLAGYEAIERDRRDGFLHELTTSLVRKFDAIAVQRFEVAPLMEKESTKKKRRLARIEDPVERNAAAEDTKKQRPMKPVRKLMRRVAMARCGQLLEYKFKDLRGPDAYQEIDAHDVNATACSGCGSIHPEWKETSGIVRCHEVLANGKVCGTALPRNRNAARLTKRELDVRRKNKVDEAV
jgi:transposase